LRNQEVFPLKISNMGAKLAAVTALPFLVSAAAEASSTDLPGLPMMGYSRSTDRETWRSVMLVSGILLVAGLVDDNGALILIGGAGLLVSLSHTNGNYYSSVGRSMDLARFGAISMGVNPLGGMKLTPATTPSRPSLVVQAKFKF
jgi:hypothetical protein